MSFWANLTQQINNFVDTTKSVIASAAANPDTPTSETNEFRFNDSIVRVDEVEVGELINPQHVDAEVFPSFAIVLDSLSGQTSIGEKRLVGVSRKQIFELAPSTRGNNLMSVVDAHPLDALAKLRFRKGDEKKSGLLMLELKSGTVLKYVLRDPLPCVEVVRNQMAALGIAGNVTRAAGNSSRFAEIKTAQELFQRASDIAQNFTNNSSTIDLVREMMDVLRVATEKFAAANDGQYSDVQRFAREFLSRSDVLQILDAAAANSVNEESSSHVGISPSTKFAAVTSSSTAQLDSGRKEFSPLPAEQLQLLVSPTLALPNSLQRLDRIQNSNQGQIVTQASLSDSNIMIGNNSRNTNVGMHQQLQDAVTFCEDECEADHEMPRDRSNLLRNSDPCVSSNTEELADSLEHLLGHLDEELKTLLGDNEKSFSRNTDMHISGTIFDEKTETIQPGEDDIVYRNLLEELNLPDLEKLDESFAI